MNKEIFKRYAELKTAIKQLTEEAKVIEEQVTAEMEMEAIDKVNSDFGTFFFTSRKKYHYSEGLVAREIELKALKKEEEKTAEFQETKSLSFRTK
jgi:hypothetical protein